MPGRSRCSATDSRAGDDSVKPVCLTIVCPGHSGSTLLGMCLNSHSDIHTFGEFASLKKRFNRIRSGKRRGLCSFCYAKCEFLDSRVLSLLKLCYYSRLRQAAYLKSVLTHPLYVNYLARQTKARVVCDTSKSVPWAAFVDRYCRWGLDLKYIFLNRDPRGVIAAHIRKNRDIDASIANFKRVTDQMSGFREALKSREVEARIFDIQYEKFAGNPEKVLKETCEWLGVEFEQDMLKYDQHEHHIVGGNDKARSMVKRNFNQSINYNKPDINWYLDQDGSFFLDERWKTELSNDQRARIEKELGAEIERLGYPC